MHTWSSHSLTHTWTHTHTTAMHTWRHSLTHTWTHTQRPCIPGHTHPLTPGHTHNGHAYLATLTHSHLDTHTTAMQSWPHSPTHTWTHTTAMHTWPHSLTHTWTHTARTVHTLHTHTAIGAGICFLDPVFDRGRYEIYIAEVCLQGSGLGLPSFLHYYVVYKQSTPYNLIRNTTYQHTVLRDSGCTLITVIACPAWDYSGV